MQLSQWMGDVTTFTGDLLVIGRFEDGTSSEAEGLVDAALGGALTAAADRLLFSGKARQTVEVDTLGRISASRVALVGLGSRDGLDVVALRDYGAIAVNTALAGRYSSVGVVAPSTGNDDAVQLSIGAQLGTYRFTDLQAEPEDAPHPTVDSLTLIGADAADGAFERAAAIASSVNLSRTLINEPANICTPERFEALAREIAEAPGFSLTVLNREEIIARGMGGIQGVSRGASREPRFIHMSYTPTSGNPKAEIALVGKGLTFDSGGLSIKPAKGMEDMYIDMSGAAAVFGAMRIVAKLQPEVAVHGIVGACENMTGADAYRPSDVLTMYSGKTVEVLNTDAEGRLVLADCLHHAAQLEPDCIIDLATLTGACVVALGPHYAGLFSDDDQLAQRILDAADGAGETIWRMPLDPKLAESLKSKRADITNLGGRYGGAITAAQFLQHFKGDIPWAHLDIAGPVLAAKDDGYIRAGGTGFAVMTLWSFIESNG